MRKSKPAAFGLLAAFVLWTVLVCRVDVQAIGPLGSAVGLASINGLIHRVLGVHMTLYIVTDWLGLVPLVFVLGFALLGLKQWIGRKSIRKVDCSLLVLGGFYLAVMAAYLFFEICVVDYRPVLIKGILEPSYPSSTTMLVMCVMPTALMQLNSRIRKRAFRRGVAFVLTAFTALMVLARFVSGVHWFSDIIGGGLISAGLVMLYHSTVKHFKQSE